MIHVTRDDGRVTLTLDRQDKANALTKTMLETLSAEVEAASGRDRVLVLTGAGRVFSAGADLDAARAGLATDPVWEELSGRIAAFPGLTIAALNGSAAGGALGMVFACDLRVAVPGAKIFYPVMKLGFLPQPSDPGRLAALIGPSRAKLILMAGAKISTDEACGLGLVDRLVEPDALEDAVGVLGADALGATPEHVAAIKSMIGA